jgi:hypothetical protein
MIPVQQISSLNVADLPARASKVSHGIEMLGGAPASRRITCVNVETGKVCNRFFGGPNASSKSLAIQCSLMFPCCEPQKCSGRYGY